MSTRLLLPNEFDLYRDHIQNLDDFGLFCRFGGYVSKESIQKYLTTIEPSKNIIIGHFVDNKVVGAAIVAFNGVFNKDHCEIAISVDPKFRKKGIGIKIFKRAIFWACSLGFKKILLQCLQQNQWMINQARKMGFHIINEEGEVFATMEPESWQKLGLPFVVATEIWEWNYYVLENVFGNCNIFNAIDKSINTSSSV